MKMFKTTPAQAGGSIELLRLLAKADTTANATATSTAKSGEPLLSNTNTGSPHPKLIVGLRLSRTEIVSHDTRRAMALLNGLRQEKAIAWIARGNLVLSVDGYDNDPRELYEIPEVCRFLRSLHTQWKYWFFFANEIYATLQVACKCIVGGTKATPNLTQLDADSFDRFYRECADACNDLCDKFGFPEEENQKLLLSAYQQLTYRPQV